LKSRDADAVVMRRFDLIDHRHREVSRRGMPRRDVVGLAPISS
jgi:hypothetical protein